MNRYVEDFTTDVALFTSLTLVAALVGVGAFLLTVGGALVWRRVH